MWYLVGLVWIAFVAGILWSYKNIRTKREVAHNQKFREILTLASGGIPVTGSSPSLTHAPPLRQSVVKKKRMVDAPTTLLYYVLRTGMPDHEIFIDISLSRLIEGTTLPNARVNFVICSREMEIIAVIMSGEGAQTVAIEQQLDAAGIRIVHLNAMAPPRYYEVRALIYGSGTTS